MQGEAGAAVHRLPRRCRHARLRSRERRRALVWDGTTNGKGSENYVDDARKLGPEHLKFIDDFISETHAAGGTVSIPTCADELAKKFARLYVSEGCVRYAMVNYCDAGGGYGWGNIKPTKCEMAANAEAANAEAEAANAKAEVARLKAEVAQLETSGKPCPFCKKLYVPKYKTLRRPRPLSRAAG